MRKRIVTGMLAAAVGAALVGLTPLPGRVQAVPPPAAQGKPEAAQAQVPVRQVVLFSSGVGYFEHFGSVTGNGSAELRFKTAQINDILKSLVLQDMDKGRVSVVTYPSRDPIAKTLRSFQVDITNNPALHDLLNQLRGAAVTASLGAEKVKGVVLGVEKKQRPVGKGDDGKVADVWILNLLIDGSIRPVPLDEVRAVDLEDAQLREELNRALTALSQARDQDKKPVTIQFQGQGERRVRIGYVVESPVWKTSYRLLLDGPAKAEGEKGKVGEGEKRVEVNAERKPETRPVAGAGAAGPTTEGNLQGWAIIENQTESDWNDVQLSLISGRPISFIQDLYSPLYVPRPTVQPELYASLRPQTYDAGLDADLRKADRFAEAEVGERLQRQNLGAMRGASTAGRPMAPGAPAPTPAPVAAGATAAAAPEELAAMDASASVSSVASATKLGELFQYTVGSVTLPRQKSAMIPVVTDPVEVEKLSIYNQGVLAKHPLYGARVKNTTGKHLLQGPVTVLQGGTYAGDARIDDLPPGQERLISYGVDLQVLVVADNQKQDSVVTAGKIVKGVLHLTRKITASQDYAADNKADFAKTLVIEHPRRQGWKLVQPEKAAETTDALYRFKDRLETGKPKKLTVSEELVTGELIAILPADVGQLDFYARTGPIPQPVKDALGKAIGLKNRMTDTERQINERQQEVQRITQEQQRLRDNMKTVAPNTDYYNRLLKKLNEQETRIEQLQTESDTLRATLDKQRKELEDYLGGLTVG